MKTAHYVNEESIRAQTTAMSAIHVRTGNICLIWVGIKTTAFYVKAGHLRMRLVSHIVTSASPEPTQTGRRTRDVTTALRGRSRRTENRTTATRATPEPMPREMRR